MYQRLADLSKARREREAADAEQYGYDHEHDHQDMFYEELDIKKYNSCIRSYITAGLGVRIVVKHSVFSAVMNICILLAGLLVGLSTYESITSSRVKQNVMVALVFPPFYLWHLRGFNPLSLCVSSRF